MSDDRFDCSGLVIRHGTMVCQHGFPVFPACNKDPMKHGQVPCMSEPIAARLFPDTGKPEPGERDG